MPKHDVGETEHVEARCILVWCQAEADAGRSCRRHWDELIARDVQIEAFQSAEYLARELVHTRRLQDFLVQQSGIGNEHGACCGHLLRVHAEGGCFGLSLVAHGEYGGEYALCKCLRWAPHSGSSPHDRTQQEHT